MLVCPRISIFIPVRKRIWPLRGDDREVYPGARTNDLATGCWIHCLHWGLIGLRNCNSTEVVQKLQIQLQNVAVKIGGYFWCKDCKEWINCLNICPGSLPGAPKAAAPSPTYLLCNVVLILNERKIGVFKTNFKQVLSDQIKHLYK